MRTIPLILTAAWVALILGQTPAAIAEDVKVKVIDPDKAPAATTPDNKPAPGSTNPAEPRPAENPAADKRHEFQAKDWFLDYGLRRLKLTESQQAAISDALAEHHAAFKTGYEAWQKMSKQLYAEARKEGLDPDARQALYAEARQGYDEHLKATEGNRKALLDKLEPLLDEKQRAMLAEVLESWDRSPAGRAKRWARNGLRAAAYGVELTDAQQADALEAVAPLYLEYLNQQARRDKQARELYPAIREAHKAGDEAAAARLREQLRKLYSTANYAELNRRVREKIDPLLTPEQLAAVTAKRQEQAERFGKYIIQAIDYQLNAVRKRAENVKLTEPQARQVKELTDAARAAAVELEYTDWRARNELMQRLDADVESLLTDAQQEAWRKASPYRYGRPAAAGDKSDSRKSDTRPGTDFREMEKAGRE